MILSPYLLFCTALAWPWDKKPTAGPIVTLKQGKILGLSDGKVQQFLGIPYAKPPLQNRRFRQAEPLDPGTGLFNATKYGFACMGDKTEVNGNSVFKLLAPNPPPIQDEDCLNLDIYVPEGGKDLPVMVWNFPGSLVAGDSQGPGQLYVGTKLIERFPNVILVSFNSRIGAFGFLATKDIENEGSLNAGFYDTEMVFKWVKENIAAFGGNPKRVLAFGNSSGSLLTATHLLTDKGKQDLFQRIIFSSGTLPVFGFPTVKDRGSYFDGLFERLNCTGSKRLECMRKVKASDIVSASTGRYNYTITADNRLPSSVLGAYKRGEFSRVPTIINTMGNEGVLVQGNLWGTVLKNETEYKKQIEWAYGLKSTSSLVQKTMDLYDPAKYKNDVNEAFGAFYGDYLFECASSLYAKTYTAAKVPVWKSKNRAVPMLSRLVGNSKSFHTADLPFIFQARQLLTPFEYNFANRISKAYTDFANGMDPMDADVWPTYGKGACSYGECPYGTRLAIDKLKLEEDDYLQSDFCKLMLEVYSQ